jgi:hypothetical protein
MGGATVSKEWAKSPDWCEVHGGWLTMCPFKIDVNDPDFRDKFQVCLSSHDEKVLVEDRKMLSDVVYSIPLSKNLNSNENQAGWAFKARAAEVVRYWKSGMRLEDGN